MSDPLDLSSLGRALPSPSSEVKSKPKPKPLEIRILSWNIHGPRLAEARNLLVPLGVKKMNPDIVLLQETKTDKLIESIKVEVSMTRAYREVCAGIKGESRILYDSNLYEDIPRSSKVFHDNHHKEPISLYQVFERSLEKLFPEQQGRELRGGTVNPMKTICRERISIVGLKHRHQELTPERVIIFMSFHNVNTSQGVDVRSTMASKFCELVATIRDLTDCVVVAGADLNCSNINKTVAVIPDYHKTARREQREKIDYFILASPPSKVVPSPVSASDFVQADDVVYPPHTVDERISLNVSALDFFQDEASPLYPVVRDLMRQVTKYDVEHYKQSLDHDPLICDLRVVSH